MSRLPRGIGYGCALEIALVLLVLFVWILVDSSSVPGVLVWLAVIFGLIPAGYRLAVAIWRRRLH